MSREPVIPTSVYQPMATHYPVEEYQAQHCQCGHSHSQAPVQNITIKQADPWLRYIGVGFAGAGIGLLVFASIVATLIAAGACALCVAVATWALRGLFNGKKAS
ncbi:hypothetical protein EV284_6465 [Streptomyces sp. BK022]|uniref:hypothetical protein n=1 Tax=Streptomyces sp. BK022 TaxID=2512123 RepID=UPI00102954CC|nr:hypothetical protein [Streptomyces sp. BK022]RZU28299.1 hypothetical protein EV284_6465 [Streptomyces sp. BK022]